MSRWLRRSERVLLGIGPEALGWLAPAQGREAQQALLRVGDARTDARSPVDWTASFNALFARMAPQPPRTELHVTVDDTVARQWLVTPPEGLGQFTELQALAAWRFEALFREPASAWVIQGDWSAQAAFVCAALPRACVEALQTSAAQHGFVLGSMQPRALRLMNRLLPLPKATADAWLCAFGPAGFSALLLVGGQPLAWQQHWCDAPLRGADVTQRLRAQALIAEHPMPRTLWAAGEVPEFVAPSPFELRQGAAHAVALPLPTRGVIALAACGVPA